MSKKPELPKVSMSSTKNEMMDAYNAVVKQLEQQQAAELKPEKKIEEKKIQEVVKSADAISVETIAKEIAELKIMISKTLSDLDEKIEGEVVKYQKIKEAIAQKEKEFNEIYDINKSAATLAALIESSNYKKLEFEATIAEQKLQFETEMAARKEKLAREIEETKALWELKRAQWEKEKQEYEQQVKEKKQLELQKSTREKEETEYQFQREQQLARNKFIDEKTKVEKELAATKEAVERELQLKKEQTEKELLTQKEQLEKTLQEREKLVADREQKVAAIEHEFIELKTKINNYPKELETAVTKAVKEVTDRLKAEAMSREQLIKKENDGERNALNARIESLMQKTEEQNALIDKLTQQLEKSYEKVQDIAIKAIEGSSNLKTLTEVQQFLAKQNKPQMPDKV